MSRQNNRLLVRAVGSALVLAALLGGCSSQYYDRRETVALYANDAVATNEIVQMIDPWPRHSDNKNIAFNGAKMQSAVERYRTNKVTPPTSLNTSSAQFQQQSQQPTSITVNAGATGQAAPAAPVK